MRRVNDLVEARSFRVRCSISCQSDHRIWPSCLAQVTFTTSLEAGVSMFEGLTSLPFRYLILKS